MSTRRVLPPYTGPHADNATGRFTPQARFEAHLEYARKCYEDVLKDVPYAHMTRKELKLVCEARGVLQSGKSDILIRRLKMLDQGEIEPTFVTQATHFEPPTLVNGYDANLLLVGLPHFVVRHVFCFVSTPDLINCAVSCKYLSADALIVLQARAREVIGGPKASIMALSLYDWIEKQMEQGSRNKKPWHKRLHVNRASSHTPQSLVLAVIEGNGSVENYALSLRRNGERLRVERAEQESLRHPDKVAERLENFEREMRERGVTVPFFKLDKAGEPVELSSSSHALLILNVACQGGLTSKISNLVKGKTLRIEPYFVRPWTLKFFDFCEKLIQRWDFLNAEGLLYAIRGEFQFDDDGVKSRATRLSWEDFASIMLQEPRICLFPETTVTLDRSCKSLRGFNLESVLCLDVEKRMIHCVFMDRFAAYAEKRQAIHKAVTDLGLLHVAGVVVIGRCMYTGVSWRSIVAAEKEDYSGS